MKQEEASLQKLFRYLEWISIGLLGLAQYFWITYAVQLDLLNTISFLLLALLMPLAAILPTTVRWRFWQIIAQSLLVSTACALGIHQRSSLYFLVLGAKAAVLLPRKQLLIVAGTLLAGRIFAGTLSLELAQTFHLARAKVPAYYNSQVLEDEAKIYFTIALITVLFLGRKIIAERQSRLTAQNLAKEAEKLAVDLARNKIAMEINDSLGHILASQLIQLELAGKLIESDELDKAEELVTKSYESSVLCLQELRKAVVTIRKDSENDNLTI